jgi:hypothetical protein
MAAAAQRAGHTVGHHGEPRKRIGSDVRLLRPHLVRGDVAVAIDVDADDDFQVAQGDLPLAADAGRIRLDLERKVAVTGFVSMHCARSAGGEQQQKPAQEQQARLGTIVWRHASHAAPRL